MDEPVTDVTADHAAVVTPAAVNGHGTDAALDNAVVVTPAAVNEHGTDAAPEDAAVDVPIAVNGYSTDMVIEDTAVNTLDAVNGHGTDMTVEDITISTLSRQTDNSSAESSFTIKNIQIRAQSSLVLSCLLSIIIDLLYFKYIIRIIIFIFLKLIN